MPSLEILTAFLLLLSAGLSLAAVGAWCWYQFR